MVFCCYPSVLCFDLLRVQYALIFIIVSVDGMITHVHGESKPWSKDIYLPPPTRFCDSWHLSLLSK